MAAGQSSFSSWPTLPPTTSNSSADCLGVINDGWEFALWLSPHILTNTARVLIASRVPDEVVPGYTEVLTEIAYASEVGVIDVPRTVHDCAGYEDNLVLDLADRVGAFLIASDDTDLTSISPRRGTPILRPREFATRVDAHTSSLNPSPLM